MDNKYLATPSDGKEISRLLESPAKTEIIDVVYTRRPDAYESYMKESGTPYVYVYKKDDKIISTCSELIRDVYINGEKSKAAYICGLKKDKNYEANSFGINLFKNLIKDNVDAYYCTTVKTNDNAIKIFEKSRKLLQMTPVTELRTYMLNPKVKIKMPKHNYTFKQATEKDIPNIIEFLNKEGKNKTMFPVIESIDQFYNLHYDDFYMLMNNDEILAVGALWNTTSYKQYTVIKYHGIAKLLRLFNPLLSLLGYVKLTKENEPLNFPMLSFFISKNNIDEYLKILFIYIKNEANKNYNIMSYTVPKNNNISKLLDKLPKISLDSIIYEIKFPWKNIKYKSISDGEFYVESGLI